MDERAGGRGCCIEAKLRELSEDGGRGARDIRRTIRKNVEDAIATILIENAGTLVTEVSVVVKDGEIAVEYK